MSRDPSRSVREAWIVDAVRTPIGRYGGALAAVRPDDLAALVLRALVDRTGIDPAVVEDVILGCANQAGEDNRNVARMALLLAGLPVEVAGLTVNRLCGSGLQAVNSAAHAIAVGDGDVFVAGGVESMTRAPYVMLKPESAVRARHARARRHDARLALRQPAPRRGLPGDLARARPPSASPTSGTVSRERQDAFALESQRRAAAAIDAGRFDAQLVPVPIPQRKGDPVLVARDEHPRAGRHRRGAREAAAGVPRGRHRDGRERVGDQRRGVGPARRRGGARPGDWGCGRWRASLPRPSPASTRGSWGSAPCPAIRKAARARRADGRRHRSRGAQRGVRLAVGRLHRRARARPGAGQPQRRRDRPGPSRSVPPARGW